MENSAAGKFLKVLREERGLSLREAGRRIGWSYKQIGRWESDPGTQPPYEGIRKLLKLLDCPPVVFDKLFDEGKIPADGMAAAAAFLQGENNGQALPLTHVPPDAQVAIRQLEETEEGRNALISAAERYLSHN